MLDLKEKSLTDGDIFFTVYMWKDMSYGIYSKALQAPPPPKEKEIGGKENAVLLTCMTILQLSLYLHTCLENFRTKGWKALT